MITNTRQRVLVLLVCLGLGALLVGLSAAHTTLPGDTFQVAPRAVAAAGAAVVLPGDPDTAPPAGNLLAILPVALVVATGGGLLVARTRHAGLALAARTVPATGCRGPPSPVTR